MENQNMESNQVQQGANGNQQQNNQGQNSQNQQSEKLFTQEDVNRIVQDRLARYKGSNANNADNGNSDGFSEREKNLAKRELTLEAKEKMAEAGLPKDLLKVVNLNSKEEMEESIKVLTGYFGMRKAQQTYRVSTGTQTRGNFNNSSASEEANIRKAMGLKGR